MLRRSLLACLAIVALSAGRAEALTIRDIIELSKAGLGDQVLLALIEVDRSMFAIDTATIRKLGIAKTRHRDDRASPAARACWRPRH